MLMCDMAHFAGLVAAGLHPNPVPHCDFVTSTTHKTLAGPRAGFVLCREEHAAAVDRRDFPGMQGGPLMHTIAAKAACFRIAATERVPRLPAAGARERRHARRGAHRAASTSSPAGRTRISCSSTSARPSGRARAQERLTSQDDRQPQHGAVRRAAADGRVGRPHRHPGGDDARLRRGRLPRGRARSSSTRSPTTPTSTRSRARSARSATRGRSTPASAVTRPT